MPFIKRDTHKCSVPLPASDYQGSKWYCPKCFKVYRTYYLRPDIDITNSIPRQIEGMWVWQWTGEVMEQW